MMDILRAYMTSPWAVSTKTGSPINVLAIRADMPDIDGFGTRDVNGTVGDDMFITPNLGVCLVIADEATILALAAMPEYTLIGHIEDKKSKPLDSPMAGTERAKLAHLLISMGVPPGQSPNFTGKSTAQSAAIICDLIQDLKGKPRVPSARSNAPGMSKH